MTSKEQVEVDVQIDSSVFLAANPTVAGSWEKSWQSPWTTTDSLVAASDESRLKEKAKGGLVVACSSKGQMWRVRWS